MTSDVVFLFSSRTRNPKRFFQGYFFDGTDYVFGPSGLEKFCQTRGGHQPVREDGCYVLAEETDGGYLFSADCSGFKKIFYFWDSEIWVVSNSLYRLAAHLREHGYSVSPNVSQLAAMTTEGTFYPSGRGSFFSQMTSFETIVRGVRLVPIDCALRIGPSGVRLEHAGYEAPDGTYRDQLGHFLGIWVERFRTLMQQESMQVSCDLTGGLDTRAVFALLYRAYLSSATGVGGRLQLRTGGDGYRARRDLSVANNLCAETGLTLNGRLSKSPTWLSGDVSYARWKELCLGVYHPIYFPGMAPSAETVYFGGGGGENHRSFYSQFVGAPSADRFVASRTRNVKFRSAREQFAMALQEAIDSITDSAPAGTEMLDSHYQHFRNRFHAGREPQYSVVFQPLASKLLRGIEAARRQARMRDGQLHYDILHNLKPEFLDVAFDKRSKRPGPAVRKSLTTAAIAAAPPGSCFIDPSESSSLNQNRNGRGPWDFLRDEFARSKQGCAVELLGSRYVSRADRIMQEGAALERLSGSVQSKRVACVIACSMFDS